MTFTVGSCDIRQTGRPADLTCFMSTDVTPRRSDPERSGGGRRVMTSQQTALAELASQRDEVQKMELWELVVRCRNGRLKTRRELCDTRLVENQVEPSLRR